MAQRPTPERLTEIRANAEWNPIMVDERALLAEVDALTHERDEALDLIRRFREWYDLPVLGVSPFRIRQADDILERCRPERGDS